MRTTTAQILKSILLGIGLLLGIYLAGWPFILPAPVGTDAAPDVFSAARAMAHIQAIGETPHPIGSPEHSAVRAYIISQVTGLGLEPEVQSTLSIVEKYRAAGWVQNILVRVPGSSPTGAVAVMAHYDTQPQTPGAADNSAGVGVLLETLRVVRAGPQPKNDLIFLFTDGEDAGLMGAAAFTADRSLMQGVKAVVNLDGVQSWPVVVGETGIQNAWVVQQMAGLPVLRAYSWTSTAYQTLLKGLDFDYTLFRDQGVPGYNLMTVYNFPEYHGGSDIPERLSPAVVQQAGESVLALANRLGGVIFNGDKEPAATNVYFNFGPLQVNFYDGLCISLSIVCLAGWAWIAAGVIRRREVTWSSLGAGLAVFLAGSAALLFLLNGAAMLLKVVDLQGSVQRASPHLGQDGLYFWALALLAAGGMWGIDWLVRNRLSERALILAGLLVSALLALALSILAPGFSYLLIFPSAFCLLAEAWYGRVGEETWGAWILQSLALAAALAILGPFAAMAWLGVGLAIPALVIGTVILLAGLLLPQMERLPEAVRRILPVILVAAGLALGGMKLAQSGFSPAQPRPDDMGYLLNAGQKAAVWLSRSEQTDAWTQQFLGSNPQAANIFPSVQGANRVLQADAPVLDLPSPLLEVLSERVEGKERVLRLKLSSPRHAETLILYADPALQVTRVNLEGRDVTGLMYYPGQHPESWHSLTLRAPGEQGFTLELRITSPGAANLILMDESVGLPAVTGMAIQPRPADLVSDGDFTWVVKDYKIQLPAQAQK